MVTAYDAPGARIPGAAERHALAIERITPALTFREEQELDVIRDLFTVDDLLPALAAYARGDRAVQFSGWRQPFALSLARRASTASPFAVSRADWLINSAFDKHQRGVPNDEIAEYELTHHLGEVFEYPDALLGLDATMRGAFPAFLHRFPL